jgi:hypothetical protein
MPVASRESRVGLSADTAVLVLKDCTAAWGGQSKSSTKPVPVCACSMRWRRSMIHSEVLCARASKSSESVPLGQTLTLPRPRAQYPAFHRPWAILRQLCQVSFLFSLFLGGLCYWVLSIQISEPRSALQRAAAACGLLLSACGESTSFWLAIFQWELNVRNFHTRFQQMYACACCTKKYVCLLRKRAARDQKTISVHLFDHAPLCGILYQYLLRDALACIYVSVM